VSDHGIRWLQGRSYFKGGPCSGQIASFQSRVAKRSLGPPIGRLTLDKLTVRLNSGGPIGN
jgi:hypothetical protein